MLKIFIVPAHAALHLSGNACIKVPKSTSAILWVVIMFELDIAAGKEAFTKDPSGAIILIGFVTPLFAGISGLTIVFTTK